LNDLTFTREKNDFHQGKNFIRSNLLSYNLSRMDVQKVHFFSEKFIKEWIEQGKPGYFFHLKNGQTLKELHLIGFRR